MAFEALFSADSEVRRFLDLVLNVHSRALVSIDE
jgi:hypothetical protein